MMAADLFVDGIGGISISAGMVRLELVSQSPAGVDIRQRVVMPVQGFLDAYQRLGRFGATLAPAAAPAGSLPKSPNFG